MELISRITDFWSWFSSQEASFCNSVERAVVEKDYETLKIILQGIHGRISEVSKGIDLNLNSGKAGCLLTIRASEPAIQKTVDTLLEMAPNLAHWRFSNMTNDSPPKEITTRDDNGGELIIPYDGIRFAILPSQPDGKRPVAFLLAKQFDPKGPEQHLYRSAAEGIFQHIFGHIPANVAKFAILPASEHPELKTHPLLEFQAAWSELDKPK